MPPVIADEWMRGYAVASPERAPGEAGDTHAPAQRRVEMAGPNVLVRWAFYLSAFSIPFTRLYVPGTGERFGVIRVVQFLFLCALVSQPRICLRLVPTALLWFVAYCTMRVLSGLWFAPELSASWFPVTWDWLQFSLPWVWIMFNLLQFPEIRRAGLWALVWGCSLCALLHILGIGVTTVDNSLDEIRTTVFGENANVVGATYAVALIALIGMAIFTDTKLSRRSLTFPLIALIGVGLAKTGSRSSGLMVAMGAFALLFQAESFSSRLRRYTTSMLVLAILAGVVWQVPVVMQRFKDLSPSNLKQEEGRARMAPVLWEMFLRSPVYGLGPDQYRYELTRRAMPYLIRDQRTIVAHNLALLLLVETGIVGFLLCSTGLCKTLAIAWRARLGSCGSLPLALFLPFVVSGIFLSNPTSDHVFWFTVAYALAVAA